MAERKGRQQPVRPLSTCPECGWRGSVRGFAVHIEKWHPDLALPETFLQCRVDQITEELPHVKSTETWAALVEEREKLVRVMEQRFGGPVARFGGNSR